MAATNGCEAWATWTGGRLVTASGYGLAFAIMAGVSLLAIPIVWLTGKQATRDGEIRTHLGHFYKTAKT